MDDLTQATAAKPLTVFDGHIDTLLRLRLEKRSFFERNQVGHVDLPRAREGHLGGAFCAVYVPAPGESVISDPAEAARAVVAAFPHASSPPAAPDLCYSQRTAIETMACLFRIERESQGRVRVVRSAGQLEACLQSGVFAALLHFEGADAIDPDLAALEVFYQTGLRSIGIVHSRPNIFGHGVPFAFPHSPDTGPGLTEAGKNLVRACNRLRIMIDLSHLTERGFWDVAKLTNAPLVATHSNAHAITPATRNLTDQQLAAIRESDGMVGVNFHVGFLRADGKTDQDTPLDDLVRHIDYLVEHLGIDRVGMGSDFEYVALPREVGDATGLPKLFTLLHRRGYDDDALAKLAHQNWIRVLGKTWEG
jgi:membrane dipeptidase